MEWRPLLHPAAFLPCLPGLVRALQESRVSVWLAGYLCQTAAALKAQLEETQAELNEEIVRGTRCRRALSNIEELVTWARTPPSSARSRQSTPK
jgi:hypothetical protein